MYCFVDIVMCGENKRSKERVTHVTTVTTR